MVQEKIWLQEVQVALILLMLLLMVLIDGKSGVCAGSFFQKGVESIKVRLAELLLTRGIERLF